jgi:hypothetical protein
MRHLLLGLVLLLVAGSGCGTLPKLGEDTKPAPPTQPAPKKHARRGPTVTADQVNEGNAHQVSNALWEELDQDTPDSGEPVETTNHAPKKP